MLRCLAGGHRPAGRPCCRSLNVSTLLLWYPVQFEGNECSPDIMYSGAQPNQQILPALDWAFEKGKKRVFLLGSDYVFPRTANLILKKHILHGGGVVAGEEYVPLGGTDFSSIITKIKIAHPDVIFSTLNGDSNVSFFKQLAAAGITQAQLTVMSFSIAEQEAKAMGPSLVNGSYAAWNYFQSLNNPANKKFIAAYKAKFGSNSVLDDPMVHGYIDVICGQPQSRRRAVSIRRRCERPQRSSAGQILRWGPVKFADNQSLYQTAYVGQLQPDGQFKILWQSKQPLRPEPYDALAFPGRSCVIK